MELESTPLQDCFIVNLQMHGDHRGFFLESFNQKVLDESGIDFQVKQINFAKSQQNVFRGLHYQLNPYAQAKLVGVIAGHVKDVMVDLRRDSPTFQHSFEYEISAPDTLLLIPRGFAHGYLTLSPEAIFYYAVDNFYNPEAERGIQVLDSSLGINIAAEKCILSEKDRKAPRLEEAEINF